MSLRKRIIASVLVGPTGQAVKGRAFAADRPVGSVLQAIRVHQSRGVDELVVLFVGQRSEPDFATAEAIAEEIRSPLAIGGGIRTLEHVDRLMRIGADKVVLRTAWDVIGPAAARYGSQAVVFSLDVRGAAGTFPAALATAAVARGAGEILLQSVDGDGCLTGYDISLIGEVAEAVSVPVIASGGCRGETVEAMADDMDAALSAGASACAAGAAWLFCDVTPRQVKAELARRGHPVRLERADDGCKGVTT